LEEEQKKLFMARALELAIKAMQFAEVPVGAVIVLNGEIIGEGFNSVISDNSVSSHAEINAINMASKKIGNHRLIGCDMFSTLEPCYMCASAIVHARIRKLYFSSIEPKSGAIISNGNFFVSKFLNHKVEFSQGILQKETSLILKNFFQNLRSKKK
tara:strand:- start:714 stop:1181 length:468 start_codon:yes stop_codon:yes gene_type:complete